MMMSPSWIEFKNRSQRNIAAAILVGPKTRKFLRDLTKRKLLLKSINNCEMNEFQVCYSETSVIYLYIINSAAINEICLNTFFTLVNN